MKVRGVSGISPGNFLLSAVVIFELLKVDLRVRSQFISMQAHQQEYHTFHYSFEFLSTQSEEEKSFTIKRCIENPI